MNRKIVAATLLSLLLAAGSVAQEIDQQAPTTSGSSDLDFGLGLAIGAQSFPNPAFDPAVEGSNPTVTYQSLSAVPDLSFGKFGIGLELTLNYRFTAGDGNEFEIRREDWVPDDDTSFLELYLPKFRYVRWGLKGDPLYTLLGTVDSGTLGNGFILGGYSNGQFLPDRRIFGLSLDVDGSLFSFPYVGVETFVSNLAAFDLIGGRLFVRPLVGTSIPVIKNLQIGSTAVVDRDPFYFAAKQDQYDPAPFLPTGQSAGEAQVLIWGVDARQPILSSQAISLAAFGDFVMQNASSGGMIGAGGRLAGIITYGAQLRFLGDNFIPVYFDSAYDLFRPQKYGVYAAVPGFTVDSYVGWFASLGFALLEDSVVLDVAVDGPFGASESDQTFRQPHLRGTFTLADGILGGFSFDASYDKKGIEDFRDLFNPEDAVIGARVNYKTGPAVISLVYDLRYDPYAAADDPWIVTSGIESSIELF